jgi:hypothetical protein
MLMFCLCQCPCYVTAHVPVSVSASVRMDAWYNSINVPVKRPRYCALPIFPPPNATEKSTCGVTVTVTGSLNPQPSFSICLLLSLNKMNISSAYGEWMDCVQDLHLQVNYSPQDAGDHTAPGPGAGRSSISHNYLSSLKKSSVNFRSIRISISGLYVNLFPVYA